MARKAKTLSLGRPASRERVIATYDSAETSARTENLWAYAQGLSANAEITAARRAIVRNRCRYEARNNSYARGMIDTKANDVVGRGPRLQMLGPDAEYNAAIEELYGEWAEEIRLGIKLRLAVAACMESGEAFLLFVSNPKLRHCVKLDVQLVECDRVAAVSSKWGSPDYEDGISYDPLGNPTSYDVLKYHPGGAGAYSITREFESSKAADVIHLFRPLRPEQRRGMPEIAPALPLFGQLRRYTLAVLCAAEAAADVAWALVSNSDNAEPVDINPMEEIELEKGSGLTMPVGWKPEQIEARQPSTTYPEFKRELLNEIARCLAMPLNIALANSSGYNYASGRLDHQGYFKDNQTRQYDLGLQAASPIFGRFCSEYKRLPGAIVPRGENDGGWVTTLLRRAFILVGLRLGPRPSGEPHEWHWDGTEHVDPAKEANAQETRLRNLTTTFAAEYAKIGLDWEDQFEQIARERAHLDKLGIELPKPPGTPPAAPVEEPETPAPGQEE
jgi:capsid protein